MERMTQRDSWFNERIAEVRMDSRSDTRAPMPEQSEQRAAPVVTADRARQATTGHNVRYVLGFGLAGIVIAFVIIYLIFFG